MPTPVRKLILPLAGLGKRLRPLTLTTPKNLIPLAGKPILEYALEEARAAGIEDAILVVSPEHVERYEEFLKEARRKFPDMQFHLRVQEQPWGNGHAILQAADLIEGEPFAVRFPDDVIVDSEPTFKRLIDLHNRQGNASIILLERIPQEEVSRYGVVKAEQVEDRLHLIHGTVEKPKVEDAPSNLIVIGGYALAPTILDQLKKLQPGMKPENDNLLLIDAFAPDMAAGRPFYGWEFPGKRLDCGTLDGLQKAEDHMAAVTGGIPARILPAT